VQKKAALKSAALEKITVYSGSVPLVGDEVFEIEFDDPAFQVVARRRALQTRGPSVRENVGPAGGHAGLGGMMPDASHWIWILIHEDDKQAAGFS